MRQRNYTKTVTGPFFSRMHLVVIQTLLDLSHTRRCDNHSRFNEKQRSRKSVNVRRLILIQYKDNKRWESLFN
jgi:hypothetical protein